MRIALLHYSTWPEVGGVETILRDQAVLLMRNGHEVVVVSGLGADPIDGYELAILPELAPDFPLNQSVRQVLDRGQADQNFNKYRAVLVEALKPVVGKVDLIIVHNIFTMHFNLPLTVALHDLAPNHRIIAWTHDLVATNHDYALPNPTKQPWNLMRTASPHVTYVTTSDRRRDEINEHLKPPSPVVVVPNFVDVGRLYNFTVEMRESLAALTLSERDFVFLLPARVMPRKNIEFAIEIVKTLQKQGRNPLLLITGAPDPNSAATVQYGRFLRDTLPDEMKRSVVFVHDFFVVKDETMHDLYAIADCLLYPSRQEGFGLPVLEAALHRLPIWCGDVPAFSATGGEGAFLIDNIARLPDAVAWLEAQPTFRLQRFVRRSFDPFKLYETHYLPLFATYATTVAA